jgi:hypothetical protein
MITKLGGYFLGTAASMGKAIRRSGSGTVVLKQSEYPYAQAAPGDVQPRASPPPHRQGQDRLSSQLSVVFRRDQPIPRPGAAATSRSGYAEVRGVWTYRSIRSRSRRATRQLGASPASAGLHPPARLAGFSGTRMELAFSVARAFQLLPRNFGNTEGKLSCLG